MSLAVFQRMLWKEYRSNQTLILGILGVGLVFQTFFMILPIPRELRFDFLYQATQVFSAFYGVAISAMLFAGEREHRTSEWLISLSPSPAPILLSKLAFAIFSTVILKLVFLFYCVVYDLWLSDLSLPSVKNRIAAEGLLILAPLIALLPALLGSFVSRQIFGAIGMMLVCCLVLGAVPLTILSIISPGYYQRKEVYIACWYGAIFLVANLVIGWQWCQGRYWDAKWVSEVRRKLLPDFSRFLSEFQTVTRRPVEREFESDSRCMMRRLNWQERFREGMAPLVAIGLSATGFALLGHVNDYLIAFQGFGFLLLLMLPMFSGLAAFEWNAGRIHLQFMHDRGVSPASVWWSKIRVWLPRAIGLTVLVAGVICLIDVNNYPAPVFAYPATQIRSLQNTYEILRLFRGDTVVCYLLMSFCCGQLAALLFRSLVLAGLFAFVANCILLIVVAALHQSASLLIFGPLFLMAQVISYLSFVRRMNSLSNDPKGFGLNLLDFERNEDSLVIRLRLR